MNMKSTLEMESNIAAYPADETNDYEDDDATTNAAFSSTTPYKKFELFVTKRLDLGTMVRQTELPSK